MEETWGKVLLEMGWLSGMAAVLGIIGVNKRRYMNRLTTHLPTLISHKVSVDEYEDRVFRLADDLGLEVSIHYSNDQFDRDYSICGGLDNSSMINVSQDDYYKLHEGIQLIFNQLKTV
jgi:hypothetical protein